MNCKFYGMLLLFLSCAHANSQGTPRGNELENDAPETAAVNPASTRLKSAPSSELEQSFALPTSEAPKMGDPQNIEGKGLKPETVAATNTRFLPLLSVCLTEQAQRLEVPASERYEVKWTVAPTGRVLQIQILPAFMQNSPFADCLRKQFALWRYPPFSGEAVWVGQTFTVNAKELHTID